MESVCGLDKSATKPIRRGRGFAFSTAFWTRGHPSSLSRHRMVMDHLSQAFDFGEKGQRVVGQRGGMD